jgi:hypothetical protein
MGISSEPQLAGLRSGTAGLIQLHLISIFPPDNFAFRPFVCPHCSFMIGLPSLLELSDEVIHTGVSARRARTRAVFTTTGGWRLLLNERVCHRLSGIVLVRRCVLQSHEQELGCEALRIIISTARRGSGSQEYTNLVDFLLLLFQYLPSLLEGLGFIESGLGFGTQLVQRILMSDIILWWDPKQ